ncbi:hypothetical protein CTA2_3096 [Colletotrichum tanaceti]|uniref:Uncharacterized protein n=1 Tax=Colletotrichum tanaceti TaxID=1306861 RepID=A0A4U6XUP4_9PEZI|nr:hypothetical protein CTA2_3096 [Colletotrichum tanaceti]TKW59710.1 hypothetical protein CTA1_10476 [Colletotrichum tanaceti]
MGLICDDGLETFVRIGIWISVWVPVSSVRLMPSFSSTFITSLVGLNTASESFLIRMASFHQCPWENCVNHHEHERGPVANPMSSSEHDIQLDHSAAHSQAGCSDTIKPSETATNIHLSTYAEETKVTEATSISRASKNNQKKTDGACLHEKPNYGWKIVRKKDQMCYICKHVLPTFILHCIVCNVQVCKTCSMKKWTLKFRRIVDDKRRRDLAHRR